MRSEEKVLYTATGQTQSSLENLGGRAKLPLHSSGLSSFARELTQRHNLRDLQPMANGSADFHRDNLQINRGRRWPFSSGLILATAAAGALLMCLIRLA